MQPVVLSIHPRIHNKPPHWLEEYAYDWRRAEPTLPELLSLISQGRAFIPAAMRSNHRNSDVFLHADLVIVDIDEGLDLDGFRAHPLAAHAAFLYTTASHRDEPGGHRFRVGFRLPHRLHDSELYKSLITLLIREFGGDKSCSDPCRLFYGCSTGRQELLSDTATLPTEWVERAKDHLQQQRQKLAASQDYDALDLEQAIYVLEEVLEPTADGERDIFVRVTAAAASAGSDLYPAWSDWASRGHHGKGKNARQTSERFFKGFSGKSSLATLFYLAQQQDPDWRRSLPDHLRKDGYLPPVPAAGYSFEDFMGDEDDLLAMDPEEIRAEAARQSQTPSIFDLTPEDWAAMRERQQQGAASASSASPAASSSGGTRSGPITPDDTPAAEDADQAFAFPEPPPLRAAAEDPDDPFTGDPLLEEDELPVGPVTAVFDDSSDPLKKRKRGRPKGSRKSSSGGGGGDGDSNIAAAKDAVYKRYPGLRLNTLTYHLEYGPPSAPVVIKDPTMSYVPVSEVAGKDLPKQVVTDVTRIIAEENSYNPVKRYLDHCNANAKPIDYFDRLAQVLLGVEEETFQNPMLPSGRLYADEVMRRFLIGAVARIFDPGCSHSWMLILVGPQNLGKSNFFQYLTPPDQLNHSHPWVTTIQQGLSYLKERPHVLHAGWLVLLDETERYFKRQYTEELKNLISVANDRSARKYENERSFPRSFVLCGATNSMDFMVDPTGNRRFMPIRVPGKVPAPEDDSIRIIDLDRVKRERDNIWAAAVRAYLDAPVHEFSSYELTKVETVHGAHTVDSPLEGSLRQALKKECSFLYKDKPAYTMSDIFKWLELGVDRSTTMTRLISDEMRRMGYESSQARIQGSMTRFWQKVA
jgi:hypothetical protein